MTVFNSSISIRTSGNADVKDITALLSECVRKSGIANGIVNVFCPGSTGALTTTEFEPGAVRDIKEFLDRHIPPTPPGPPWGEYHHHQTWHDDNGHARLRASLIGPDITAPVREGRVEMGTWRQIVFIDFDTEGEG